MNGKTPVSPKPQRRVAPFGFALAACLMAATPVAATTEYLGGGFLRMDAGCAQYGWTGTHQMLVRLEPQGVGDNAEDVTQLAMLFGTGTIAVRLNIDRGIRASYTPTQATYVWNGPYTPEEPTMTFAFGLNGEWILSGDDEIRRLYANIDNFNEHEGCTARFHATLLKN